MSTYFLGISLHTYYICTYLEIIEYFYTFTDSSRGLKSGCKFKICKKLQKFYTEEKFFFARLAKFFQFFCKAFERFFLKKEKN